MKRLSALLIAAVLVLSLCLCACGQSYAGTWKLESYDSQERITQSFTVVAYLTLNEDGTFVVTGYTTNNNVEMEAKEYVKGVYTVDGRSLSFTAQETNVGYGMGPANPPVDFTGEIQDDGKLHCMITNHTVVFAKDDSATKDQV